MNVVFDKIKLLIPFKNCLKEKQNDDLLIVSTKGKEILYLNEVSKFVFNMCNGENSIDDIKKHMLAEYDIEEDALESDLLELIRDLQWNDLIILKENI